MFNLKFKITKDTPYGCVFAIHVLFVYTVIAWIVNLYKLIQCDFVGPWKEEVIHVIGLLAPTFSWVTCWF